MCCMLSLASMEAQHVLQHCLQVASTAVLGSLCGQRLRLLA